MSLIENQIKYGQRKALNFTIDKQMKLFLQNNNTEMNYIFHMYIHISLAQLK